jgi:hypothetical protein
MRDSIFKSTETMPPMDNSPDVVRTAQTPAEMRKDFMPATIRNPDASVENITRPRRGYGY